MAVRRRWTVLVVCLSNVACAAHVAGEARDHDASLGEQPEASHEDGPASSGRDTARAGVDGASAGDASRADAAAEARGDVPPGNARLVSLIDGETGALQKEPAPHDGVTLHGCRTSETFTVGSSYPKYAGTFGMRDYLDKNNIDSSAYPCDITGASAHLWSVIFNTRGPWVIQPDVEYWLGTAVYFPPEVPPPSPGSWTLIHWLPKDFVQPRVQLSMTPDMHFRLSSFPGGPSRSSFGTAERGKWNEIVVDFVLSNDAAKGRFKLFHREKGAPAWSVIVDYKGRTTPPMATAGSFPYQVFMGLMHVGPWNDSQAVRTIYWDEIRLAVGSDALDLVSPGSGAQP